MVLELLSLPLAAGFLRLAFQGRRFLIAKSGGLVEVLPQEPARLYKEMPASHRRVEHLELENLAGLWIVTRRPLGHLGFERLPDQEPYQTLGGVVRATRLAAQAHAEVEATSRDLFDPLDRTRGSGLGVRGSVIRRIIGHRRYHFLFLSPSPIPDSRFPTPGPRLPVLLTLDDWDHYFQFLPPQAAHRLAADARLQFQKGLVHAAQVFYVERPIVDPFPRTAFVLGSRPQEVVQEVGNGSLTPAKLREHGRSGSPEQGSA